MINVLALLSNIILIVCTLEFLFSSKVPGLIWEFVEILPRGFGGKNTQNVTGDKSVAINNCSPFESNLFLN